jgi:hypothetical protein
MTTKRLFGFLLAINCLFLITNCQSTTQEEPWYLDEPLGPGEVRAGVITLESELLQGIDAHGWLGDIKLYNSKVAFIIQNIEEPRSWSSHGGTILDADIIRTPEDSYGDSYHESLQELFININYFTLKPTSLEIIADGRDNTAAIVRVIGKHQGISIVDEALKGGLSPNKLTIINEYILEPDVEYLRLRSTIYSNNSKTIPASAGDVVMNGDSTIDFLPGPGILNGDIAGGEYDYYAGFNQSSCSLYSGLSSKIGIILSIMGITPFEVTNGDIFPESPEQEPFSYERVLIVGAGGLDSCLRTFHKLHDYPALGYLGGTVMDAGNNLEAGVLIIAKDTSLLEGKNVINQTYTDSDGFFEMQLPLGSYQIEVQLASRDDFLSDTYTLVADQTTPVEIVVDQPAFLSYDCQGQSFGGASIGPMPCKISLQAGPNSALTDWVDTETLTFGATGQGSIVIPPGDWTVTLSRGFEYSIFRQEISVAAGETAHVSGTLIQQVDTSGYIAADLHNHCTRSADSQFNIKEKIFSNMAENVELLVMTDHDCQTDLRPHLERLKDGMSFDFDKFIITEVGNEVSPLYGHMTVFPLPRHPTGWSYWQFPIILYEDNKYLRSREHPEIRPELRDAGAEIINVAHPTSRSGYFAYLGFDPPDIMPSFDSLDSNKFSTDFDTIETLNGPWVSGSLSEYIPMWSALNNHGIFRTAIGVSDSHSTDREAGQGRTMIASSVDDPKDVNLEEIWDNLRYGKALSTNAFFITIEVEDASMGDLIQLTGPFEVHVTVQAADWVEAQEVRLLANGEYIDTMALEGYGQLDPNHPSLRFDGVFEVSPDQDTWYAAVALGPNSAKLSPVTRNCRPFGMTNAVRVDVDANGSFDPLE